MATDMLGADTLSFPTVKQGMMGEVSTQIADHITFKSKSPLKDLPAELVELITLCLPHLDQAALRKTCRELEAKTQRPFALTNFSDKTFLLRDPWSMQTLVDISRYRIFMPLQLEPSIELSCTKTDTQDIEYKRIRKEHERQWRFSIWQQSLSDALKNFAVVGACVSIEFDTAERDSTNHITLGAEHACNPCGRARMKRCMGYEQYVYAPLSPSIGWKIDGMLRTILDSGCHVERLVMRQVGASVPTRLFVTSRNQELYAASHTLATLDKIDLSIYSTNSCLDDFDRFVVGFISFIQHARQLKHLTLRRELYPGWRTSDPLVDALLRADGLPRLCILEMLLWSARAADLLDFLRRHARTTRRVATGQMVESERAEGPDDTGRQLYADVLDAGPQLEQFSVGGWDYIRGKRDCGLFGGTG
ncbi:hypothetical protein LTR97_008627 [Elasticomyces elasticus]|uniref:F-box domain-containing protein n=1 Tax=Elasticomyces elasticus TaxID=574655 RepID=A0AAN7W3R8_9PEZI|nr:hypothetical protein LTR97_008627 [Elasticomyces elasticus]